MTENISQLVENQRSFFQSHVTHDISFRIEGLKKLKAAIKDFEKEICTALYKDLNRSEFDSYATEIGFIYQEISHAIENVKEWSEPRDVSTPAVHWPASSTVYPQPRGVTLTIGPWNYPFQLVISPLVGALAAGNTAILKPSEMALEVSKVIAAMIKKHFVPEYVAVVEGGIAETTALLKERFEYIFFTGGKVVGQVVLEAAAKHLTPVTLELGGKSPCIVDDEVNMDIAARRITWGKFFNAGQTCVAPDYLLLPKSLEVKFLERMRHYINKFYSVNPLKNTQYGKIINERHFTRLKGLMDEGKIEIGGKVDDKNCKIEPTVIGNVSLSSKIMADEIFGPLLPVITYDGLDEAISLVKNHPNPLALYFFSKNKKHQERIIKEIPFGGGCINDTLVHLGVPDLPFGGIMESGMGGYHGKFSFDTFSHYKGILKKSFLVDVPVRYPPATSGRIKILKQLMK